MELAKRVLHVEKPSDPAGAIIEAWAQGYMVGSLIIMACVAFANMRRGVLLHKLILIELVFGMFHGTFIFTNAPVYNWYLSVTAIFLNTSWSLHNVIAWIKNKPLLPRWASIFYITTVILVQPYWILEIVANFLYFSNTSNLFVYTRPYEALFRDPWWIFTIANLLWNIKTRYDFGFLELMRVSPRFGILFGAMMLSICFILVDILAVTHVISGSGLPDGINPFWKPAFVFKCLTDTIILDDFKTALDRLKQHRLARLGSLASDNIRGQFDKQGKEKKEDVADGNTFLTGFPMVVTKTNSKKTFDPDNMDLEAALHMDDFEPGVSPTRSGRG
ncbi:hypothetical protein LTR78_006502 [Recurvomyces mirabilis]|uniref:Uncharacterized protein n=1 Tax=Recurvomyces mirabilis TaxID=574656 RepID=A0AAE1BZY4_9PEZI|nr:hypothetical protein LTR78_006502 [Recurvomyces mirabilis]KAK5151080.1 hypothetical protein LTS14_009575 [Recurvomyces mirabilis]